MKKILVWLFLVFSVATHAQTEKISLLRKGVLKESHLSKRFALLLRLLDEHESTQKDSLVIYTDEAQQIARQLNTRAAFIEAGLTKINLLLRQDQLEAATQLTDSLLAGVHKNILEEQEWYIKLSLQKVNEYAAAAKYAPATELLYQLLPLTEQLHDTISQAQCMNALGIIAYNLDKLDENFQWCSKSLALCGTGPQFDRVRAYTYINLASHFAWVEKFDSAWYYIRLAYPVCERIQNIYYLANAYIVEANICKWSGVPARAEAPMLKAIDIRKRTEGNITFSNEQLALANMYVDIKQYDKARSIYSSGINYAYDSLKRLGTDLNYDILMQYYRGLAKVYKLSDKHQLYAEALERILEIKDTLNQMNSESAMAEMQTRYSVQLKDNIIIRQKLDITRKNVLFYGSLVLLLLAAIIAWLLFRNYNRKQAMKLVLTQEEEKRKAAWAVKEAEEKERKRIAADLHDNMGSYAASIKANVEELMNKATIQDDALEYLQQNAQQMVALLGDTIWALKKEELALSAISDRLKVVMQRLRANYPHIRFVIDEQIINDIRLGPVQAYHLFMMIQEAVNNAVRHSGGNEIKIQIAGLKDTWMVAVCDNGKGMSENMFQQPEGNGYYNIRMRAEASGWEVKWAAYEPHGTCVTITATTN